MIRIHIGNRNTFPDDVIKVLLSKFKSNMDKGIYPTVYFIDNNTGIRHIVSRIINFGMTDDGCPAIDIDLKINLELDGETGEIGSATMLSNEDQEENKALERNNG